MNGPIFEFTDGRTVSQLLIRDIFLGRGAPTRGVGGKSMKRPATDSILDRQSRHSSAWRCGVITLLLILMPPQSGWSQAFNPFEKGQDEALESLMELTIRTASQQAEPLEESPVPVTVITSDMIRAIGARNLQDVLVTYVPGMSFVVDHNEINVAMRGVYASSQQKILVLLDGHRLNSRAYSMANPDYSIGIPMDKVAQIEVLRGPGSSIYGNVALTAVINIVTKAPGKLNGASISVGGGEFISGYDTKGAPNPQWLRAGKTVNIVYGKDFGRDHSLLVWGSAFSANGQRLSIDKADDYSDTPRDGFAILGGASNPASYDIGLKYNFGSFTLIADTRFGKATEPFTSSGNTGEVYDFDRYRTFWDVKPGIGARSSHIELKYNLAITDALSVEAIAYYDHNDMMSVLVADESIGRALYLDWHEDAFGGGLSTRYEYDWGKVGSGNIVGGVQVDFMDLYDSALITSADYDWTGFGDTITNRVLDPGSELIVSGILQLKHRLLDQIVLNVGARFDGKDRHRGKNIYDLSPRAAVVWLPIEQFNVKLSYSQSFVDAPYWYRYNSLASYQGSENLTPERLRSVQFTPSVSFLDGKLVNTANVFYNDLYDFVYRDPTATGNDPRYRNAGVLQSIGFEDELAFVEKNFNVRANITYQHALKIRDYGGSGMRINNVPPFMMNLIVNGKPLWKQYPNLSLNLTARVMSEQRSPIVNTFRWNPATQTAEPFSDPDNTVGAQIYLNAGFRITDLLVDNLDFDMTFYNLLDRKNPQGGSVNHPYPQAGRSFMAQLTYRLKHGATATEGEAEPGAETVPVGAGSSPFAPIPE
jgi:outer membrane receptor for ferrienterochelin and colicins